MIDTTNPFAQSGSSPFATQSGASTDDDMGEGFDLPAVPVGVLRAHTTELKKYPKGYMLYVQCDDPSYPSKTPHNIWIGDDITMLKTIASSLGITAELRLNPETRQTSVYFSDSSGNKGMKAFANKPGLFLYAPRNGEASINSFGLPKKGISPEWDQYAEERDFTEDQIKALKKARGGVIPGSDNHLFE